MLEFLLTIVAVIVGLALGRWVSLMLAKTGVPIAAGNPQPKALDA